MRSAREDRDDAVRAIIQLLPTIQDIVPSVGDQTGRLVKDAAVEQEAHALRFRVTAHTMPFGWPGRSGWQRLDATATSALAVCSPDPDHERMDVFIRGTDDDCLYRSFDGHNWSKWVSLEGVLTSDPVAMAMNGVSWVFVRGTDNAVYYLWTRGPAKANSGWQRLDVPVP